LRKVAPMKSGGLGKVKRPGFVGCPGGQRVEVGRRLGQGGAVVDQDELGHAPGALEALGRLGEVDQRGGLARGVDQREVRQVEGEGAVEEVVLLHGEEVLAVDPDQVDRPAAGLPGGLLGEHAGDRFAGVGELDVDQVDAVAVAHFVAGPGDVVVDLGGAAPGVEIDGLAAGRLAHGLERQDRRCGQQPQDETYRQEKVAHRQAPLLETCIGR
jgi:hypothetical protein